jgi:hypothetical protein
MTESARYSLMACLSFRGLTRELSRRRPAAVG